VTSGRGGHLAAAVGEGLVEPLEPRRGRTGDRPPQQRDQQPREALAVVEPRPSAGERFELEAVTAVEQARDADPPQP